jgi:sugar phosphate isomerase/epimerase
MMTRRQLLASAAATAAVLPRLQADPIGVPIGTQLYPVRDLVAKDFGACLKQIAGLGYKNVELCSPFTYREFKGLADTRPAELRDQFQSAGLRCVSCHFNFSELKQNTEERIAFAKALGLPQMVLSSFGLPATATLDDWTRAATELNKVGEQVQKAGMQLGFHNHDGEFKELDGTLIYDRLMKTFDPKLVKSQFQVSVIHLGFEAATYFKKYPGQFLSIHLQDYSAAQSKQVAVGSGDVKWKELFAAAKTAGVKNYFVEMNLEFMEASQKFLHGLM